MYKYPTILFLLALSIWSCSKEEKPIVITPNDYNNAVDKVTEVIIHDIFSPPVASRIYAYSNIAAYEVLVQKNKDYKSLAGKLTDLKPAPQASADAPVNYDLAALIESPGWMVICTNKPVLCLSFL